jgi:hypothetical protein
LFCWRAPWELRSWPVVAVRARVIRAVFPAVPAAWLVREEAAASVLAVVQAGCLAPVGSPARVAQAARSARVAQAVPFAIKGPSVRR